MALYKALASGMKGSLAWEASFGPWEKGVWYEQITPLVGGGLPGFFCSSDIMDCTRPVWTEYIAQVETDGQSITFRNSPYQYWTKMRVTSIKAWPPSKANLVVSWAEGRAHDYWASTFPTEAGLYDIANYQSQFADMLQIIQPLYKSLFMDGDSIVRFRTINHKRKVGYSVALERTIYLAYLLALALTDNVTIYGGGGLVRIAEDIRPGSWELVKGFTEDHWAGLEEV